MAAKPLKGGTGVLAGLGGSGVLSGAEYQRIDFLPAASVFAAARTPGPPNSRRTGIGDRGKVKVVELPTGSGKTRLGVAVAACLMKAGYTVLWACKSRRFLRQAADEFAHLFPECRSRGRWLGRKRSPQPLVRGDLVFSTLQTWHRRRHRLPAAISPGANFAVVWDEVHWAFGQSIGRSLREAYQGRVQVLGLSATPPRSERAAMIYRTTPEDFFGTVLAVPKFEQIETGVDWTPEVRHDEFTPDSLRRFAEDARRNTVVVQTVVGLLTEGFDHLPVDAVLLTRPTRSRRRWVQMVGRGKGTFGGENDLVLRGDSAGHSLPHTRHRLLDEPLRAAPKRMTLSAKSTTRTNAKTSNA